MSESGAAGGSPTPVDVQPPVDAVLDPGPDSGSVDTSAGSSHAAPIVPSESVVDEALAPELTPLEALDVQIAGKEKAAKTLRDAGKEDSALRVEEALEALKAKRAEMTAPDRATAEIEERKRIIQELRDAGDNDSADAFQRELDEFEAASAGPELPEPGVETEPIDPIDEIIKSLNSGRTQEEMDENRIKFENLTDAGKHAALMETGRAIINLGIQRRMFDSPKALGEATSALSEVSSPESVRALVRSLKAIDPTGERTGYKFISERVLVTGPDGEIYSLSEIDAELEDPAIKPERKKQLKDARDSGGYEVSHNIKERKQLADGVKAAEAALEIRLQGLSNRDKKFAELNNLLVKLRLSKQMRGNVGAMISTAVLRELNNKGIVQADTVRGALEAGAVLDGLGRVEVEAHLKSRGVDDAVAQNMLNDISAGRLNSLAKNPSMARAEIDILLFGREISEDQIFKALSSVTDPEKAQSIMRKGLKTGGLLALWAALMGVAVTGLTKAFD